MPFFENKSNSINFYSLFNYSKTPLRIFIHSKKVLIRKRVSLFALCKKASLTVEAALIFPFFVCACIMILYFGELFRLETRITQDLYNSSKTYAQYAGLLANGDMEESQLMKAGISGIGIYQISQSFKNNLGEEFNDKFLMTKGNLSYSFLHSKIDEDYVDLVVTYRVKFNIPLLSFKAIPIVQRCRFSSWSGRQRIKKSGDDDTIVYVTSTGTVYHRSRDCTYIRLSIQNVKYSDVGSKRNESGAKYYPCEKCFKKTTLGEVVYITNTGTRYHNNINCSELKRTVHEVRLSDVKDTKRPCNKCGNSE